MDILSFQENTETSAVSSNAAKKFKRRNVAMYSILTNQTATEDNSELT